jgi:hypothetical protein
MKKYSSMSIDELVTFFADVCVQQDQAERKSEIAKYNRLFDKMAAAAKELNGRTPDARGALVKLFDHPNDQVRLQAAMAAFDFAPDRATHVFEEISKRGVMPQAANARLALRCIIDGSLRQYADIAMRRPNGT